METMKNGERVLASFGLPIISHFKENIETPILLHFYPSKMEMLTVTLKEKRFETHIRTFDYNDLLLMNNTLNQIMGRNSK